MEITKEFLDQMIAEARREQESLRTKHAKQEGVIAFCEVLIERLKKDQA